MVDTGVDMVQWQNTKKQRFFSLGMKKHPFGIIPGDFFGMIIYKYCKHWMIYRGDS